MSRKTPLLFPVGIQLKLEQMEIFTIKDQLILNVVTNSVKMFWQFTQTAINFIKIENIIHNKRPPLYNKNFNQSQFVETYPKI